MITAPEIRCDLDFYENKLHSLGLLQDDEREYIMQAIIEAKLSKEKQFTYIAQELLYPSTATRFGEEVPESEKKTFLSKMQLTAHELTIYVNQLSGNLRKEFLSNPSSAQHSLDEIYLFLEIFYHTSVEAGLDFKLNPLSKIVDDWKSELEQNYPHAKFIAKSEMLKTLNNGSSSETENTGKRITWNGTQLDLAELFMELKIKGWIEAINVVAIKKCFTKTNSIQQPLKPGTTIVNGDEYPEIAKKSKKYFDCIPDNGTDDKYKPLPDSAVKHLKSNVNT